MTPSDSQQQLPRRLRFALELPAVLDAVALRQRDVLRHARLNVVDDAAQVAAR